MMNEKLLAFHSSLITHHSAFREAARGTDLARRSRRGRLRRTLDGAALARVLLALPSLDGALALGQAAAPALVIVARAAPRRIPVTSRAGPPTQLLASRCLA